MSRKILKRFIVIFFIILIITVIPVVLQQTETKKENKIEIVQIEKMDTEEITKDEAIEITIEQFSRLGEKTAKDKLKVDIIKINNEEYYYIKSQQNSIQIRIKGGKIVKINSIAI